MISFFRSTKIQATCIRKKWLMRRRRQTANIPNLTHSNRQDPQHMAAADIRYEMRVNATHAFQTETPQLTLPTKHGSRVYKIEDVNRIDPTIKPKNYPNDGAKSLRLASHMTRQLRFKHFRNFKTEKVKVKMLNMSDLGRRSTNDLDLWYS